jgi:exopolyphosphatase / guanosine-5'-triphosphate,3'-diphosphate pyrophosphatase
MRIGIIDCGTNTFNLLVAEATRDQWHTVFQNKLSVKLGVGGFEEQKLLPARMNRGLDAFAVHVQCTNNYQCEKVFAFATSAVREASNGAEFVAKAKEMTGVEITVIDGDREAELIWEGVRQSGALDAEPALIMDIGGGSTEFIIATRNEIIWKKSYLLGVSRLFDMVRPSDRMTQEEVKRLHALLEETLTDAKAQAASLRCKRLVGSSGSFDTLLAMHLHQSGQDMHAPEAFNQLPIAGFPKMHAWLMQSSLEERLKHPAIPSIRAEYMPLSSYLVKYILDWPGIRSITHSAYALKEGAIHGIIADIEWPEVSEEKPDDYLE